MNAKHRFGCPYARQLESASGIGIKLDRKPSKTENNQAHPSTLSHQPLCLAAQLLKNADYRSGLVSQSQRIYRISIYFHISMVINQTLLRSLDANSLVSFQFPLVLTPREDLGATRQKVLGNQSVLNLESAPLIYLKSPDTFLPNQGQHGRTPSFCRVVGVTPLAP